MSERTEKNKGSVKCRVCRDVQHCQQDFSQVLLSRVQPVKKWGKLGGNGDYMGRRCGGDEEEMGKRWEEEERGWRGRE